MRKNGFGKIFEDERQTMISIFDEDGIIGILRFELRGKAEKQNIFSFL